MAKENKFDLMFPESGDDGGFLENAPEGREAAPRIHLIQPLSEAAQDGEAKPGQLIHNLTGKAFTDPGGDCTVIPLYYWPNRVLFPPRDAGTSQILCSSLDGNSGVGLPGGNCPVCPKSQWGTGSEGRENLPPECISYHNFGFLLPDESEGERLAIASFGKTSYKAGRTILSRLRSLKQPPFAYAFQLGTKLEEKGGNRFWITEFRSWDDTNRLEKSLDLFSPSDWEELAEEGRVAAEFFRDSHRKMREEQLALPESKKDSDEVPF
jgi:hypothetical protein